MGVGSYWIVLGMAIVQLTNLGTLAVSICAEVNIAHLSQGSLPVFVKMTSGGWLSNLFPVVAPHLPS